jgi:hypothetical protein
LLKGVYGETLNHYINNNCKKEEKTINKKTILLTGGAGFIGFNLAKKLLDNTTFYEKTGVKLAGVSIGDGWTDPINQINYYDSYLWSVGVI